MADSLWRSAPPVKPEGEPKRQRVPALDGIRALAIVAVLFYHADFSWAQGGFLGVDVFFVLSGFLITGLLAGEYTRTGTISLRIFYLHRARRLLPALFTVLAGVCLYTVLFLPQEAAALRGDTIAALVYVTNWWLIAQGQSYFGGTGRPSLLINLWSLAVEEQFYVFWPPILFTLLKLRGTRRRDRNHERHRSGGSSHPRSTGKTSLWLALIGALVLAAASAVRMRALYSPWTDPSRIYYGTDTRAFELLIGAALALATAIASSAAPLSARPASSTFRNLVRDTFGLCALAALALAVVDVPATVPWLYPAGLLGACVAAVLLIRTATGGGPLAKALGLKPLVWLGQRSYALYLWHWPVFDVTRPGSDVSLSPPVDFALRIAVSLLLAHLTFHLVERPIHRGALGRAMARGRVALRDHRFTQPAFAVVLFLAILAGAGELGYGLDLTALRNPSNPDAIAVGPGPALTLAAPTAAASPSSTAPTPTLSPTATPTPTSTAIPTAMPAPPAHPPTVAFVGDSQPMTLLLNKPSNTGEYLDTIDDSTEGCDFLGGDITSRDGERRDLDDGCSGTARIWASRVSSQHPDIVVLMIGGWDEFNDEVNGVTMTFGSAAWDANYTSKLGAAVSLLRATGVPRVEVALLPCYRPIPESGSGYWPERGDDWRTRHVNTLLTSYVQSHAGAGPDTLATLQPPAAFCTDPSISSNVDYRWDGLHYYKPGSALYFQTIIPQLIPPTE